MEASTGIRKDLAVAPVFILLFFFNTCGLPQGLSLSLLLLPVWIYLLHRQGRLHLTRWLMIPMGIYALAHLLLGADAFYYAVSATLLLGIAVFALAAWPGLRELEYESLFWKLALINLGFALLSLPLLAVPQLKESVWYVMSMSDGIRIIPRLKLFTYEASHYSYLLAPLFIFFASALLFRERRIPDAGLLLTAVSLPLLLSLSFGVLGAMLLSGSIVVVLRLRSVVRTRRRLILLILSLLLLVIAAYVLLRLFPENLLTRRLLNILEGKDTSARGRTYESFVLAHRIISRKSLFWGIGPGQLKLDGRNIIVQYYFYSKIPEPVRIPNACAETLVCFGYAGLAIRILTQLWLFVRCRVYGSPFRIWLFLFLFIFQFTGSFITNTTEYIYWMLACLPLCAGALSRNDDAVGVLSLKR